MFKKNNLVHIFMIKFPLIVLMISGFFLIPNSPDYIREVCNFILVTGIAVATILLLPSKSIKIFLSLILGFALSFLTLIKLSFYNIYNVKLSASALFVIFETNAQETNEFFNIYIDKTFIGLSLLFGIYLILYAFLLIKKNIIYTLKLPVLKNLLYRITLIGIIATFAFLIDFKFSEFNLLHKTKSSYAEYTETKKLIRKNLAQPNTQNLKNVQRKENAPKLTVVIIGESTSREHMGLYGYYRNTNPLLSLKKDELIISEDVITPHVHTILALDKILTLTSFEEPEVKKNASIVQLANKAGYKTFWLSNQRPVGIHESVPTLIGYAADEKYFLNTDNYNRRSYDEVLLPKFNQVLKNPAEYKMVFLHLSGTHIGYEQRYPENFDYFKDKPKSKYKHEKALLLKNQYDNSIRYNDSIINEVIKSTAAQQTTASLIYFSDHGDDVFDYQNTAGHSEYVGTNPMFEVPYITWLSPEFKKIIQLPKKDSLLKRKYLLDDFFHSFADLNQIDFEGFQQTKSIYNQAFKPKPRIIKKDFNYDLQQ